MVQCGCGKRIEKVPAWLETVKVEFVCTNCPQRQVKSISQIHLEQQAANAVSSESDNLASVDSLDEEEDED